MSKYNLTDILNEYIGGGRIGTLKISYKDLVDKMDELEKSGKVIVREIPGPSGDGKSNREFEVVDRDSAVPGGNKQERGFTVYDYKFGFDPGDKDNFMNEYPFSVGGNDLKLAMELIDGVEEYKFEESINENIPPDGTDKMMRDLAKADEVIKMIKMLNPDVRDDLFIRIDRMRKGRMDEVMDVDRKGRKKPESKSNLTKVNEASQEESVATYIQDYYRNPKTGESMISDDMVDEFYKTHPEWEDQADGTKEGMEAVLDNFNEFFEINYGIMFDDSRDIDENLKNHFKRFM